MKRPPLTLPEDIAVPQAQHRILANGIPLYALPADDFEVVRFSLVFHAGTSCQAQPFVASATANLLDEGSTRMSARRIAERLDYYGSYFDVNIDRDCAYLSFCCLSKFFAQTLEVAEEILLDPAFPEEEIDTYRTKRRERLRIERTKIDIRAREAFGESLFGANHPYGIVPSETEYDRLTREPIVACFRSHYTADRCFIVCSGRIEPDTIRRLAAFAERIPTGGRADGIAFPAPQPRPFRFVVHEGAVQSSLRIGRLLFGRPHPDFVGMQIVAAVLGGYFGSRLMQNLRARNGYTYGVAAAMVNFQQSGYLAIATQVDAECTRAALDEIYREIERLREEPLPAAELDLVKNIMTGEMMRILDGPFGIADVTIENILCGCDNDAIRAQLHRIRHSTPEEIRDLARRYLSRDALVTVVAGDPSLEASLA